MTDESVFAAALALPDPAARAAYLDRACAGDPDLRREVAELLAAHAAANPIDRPPAGLSSTGPYHPAAADPPPAAPGDRIGPYRLMERIGEGGFGLVFVAEQAEPVRRKVALKVIKPGMDTRDVVARFEAERQALALMDHPNIATVLDAGSTPAGRPYFVMELVRGLPVTEFCDRHQLPPRDRLALFAQVCQAVQHAHQKGVIHRDLKPSNVLVASHDGVPVPKVIDFGVAKAVGRSLTEKTIYTRFAQMVGTPLYMSPEQAEMSGLDVDTRTDVYALGVLLYELLTGTTPFDRDRFREAAFDEIRRIIKEEEPPRPSTRLSGSGATLSAVSANRKTDPGRLAGLVRGELDWIVMKALEKDRNRRYESAAGFAADVRRYLAGEPVQAVPPSAGYKLRKFVRRNRGLAITGGLVAAALVLGFGGLAWGLARALAAERHARSETVAKDESLRNETEQRRRAEVMAASAAVDLDLRHDGRECVLRLARTLQTLPDFARELREYVALAVLVRGQEIAPLRDMPAATDVRLSPDGRTVLGIDPLGRVAVSDTRTGRLTFTITPDKNAYRCGFSPAGTLVWAADSGGVVSVWTTAGEPITRTPSAWLDRQSIDSVEISSDSRRMIVTSREYHPTGWGRESILLWDIPNGRVLTDAPNEAELTSRYAVFGPGGKTVVTAGGDDIRVYSADDARLLHAVPGFREAVRVAFSPDGKTAVTDCGTQLRWWSLPDWTAISPPFDVPTQFGNPRRGAGYAISFFGDDAINLIGASPFGIKGPTGHVKRGRQTGHPAAVVAHDGRLMLGDDGAVYEWTDPYRRLPVPLGRAYHPDAVRLAGGRRVGVMRGRVIDFATGKDVSGEKLGETASSFRRSPFPGCDTVDVYENHTARVRYVPEPGVAIPPEQLELWAQVVARGELGPGGDIVKWDEPTWERKRQELSRAAVSVGDFPFPGRVAADRLYWLRQAIEDAEHDSDDRLRLLNRLAAEEPTWTNFDARADWYDGRHQPGPEARDRLEAAKRAGPRYWIVHRRREYAPDRLVHRVAVHCTRREEFAFAYETGSELRAAGKPVTDQTLALLRYRLGKYDEALATAAAHPNFVAGDGVSALAGGWSALVLPGTHQYEPTMEAVKAMCYWRNGDRDAARTRLQLLLSVVAWWDQPGAVGPQTWGRTGKWAGLTSEERALVREAGQLIRGGTEK